MAFSEFILANDTKKILKKNNLKLLICLEKEISFKYLFEDKSFFDMIYFRIDKKIEIFSTIQTDMFLYGLQFSRRHFQQNSTDKLIDRFDFKNLTKIKLACKEKNILVLTRKN
ncbi:hypothetical protein BpHYR1_050181 [Brachionus plicatilis]|uniref:Uncharacterized protein n=1 Tax=Brachionus plicatilis TaxID=10195 RepID=A0A3M7S0I0_BRAPC|nr:hypothetical protein BpHYR1_050181 [Brachionus plicatilis]